MEINGWGAKVVVAVVVLVILASFIVPLIPSILEWTGNKQVIDTVYTYDYAILELPNGEVVEGNVENWRDYEGDQLQIKIDGKIYLVHSSDAVLINNGK